MLKIKTSTWIKTDTNEILIISHVPSEVTKVPIFQIVHQAASDTQMIEKDTQVPM